MSFPLISQILDAETLVCTEYIDSETTKHISRFLCLKIPALILFLSRRANQQHSSIEKKDNASFEELTLRNFPFKK